ncbi:hypothetical protein VCSRO5_1790 [Vibrio cholerae]|nr:hypothetical protein VCSRO5_1790 [Vibrio cholerae]GIB17825.1 hypothetical protein VCSRO185_1582 [Vibrio cholerae]
MCFLSLNVMKCFVLYGFSLPTILILNVIYRKWLWFLVVFIGIKYELSGNEIIFIEP